MRCCEAEAAALNLRGDDVREDAERINRFSGYDCRGLLYLTAADAAEFLYSNPGPRASGL